MIVLDSRNVSVSLRRKTKQEIVSRRQEPMDTSGKLNHRDETVMHFVLQPLIKIFGISKLDLIGFTKNMRNLWLWDDGS